MAFCLLVFACLCGLTAAFAHLIPAPPQGFGQTTSDDVNYPKLTKIRLSNFYSPSNQTQPAPLVVRLLWLTDKHPSANNIYDYYQSVGAVNMALKRLASENVLNTSVVDLEVAHAAVDDRGCMLGSGDLNIAQQIYFTLQYKFDAIIGPPCAEGALAVSAFAESLRKPHILWIATHPDFDNKQRYPYVTQNVVAAEVTTECALDMLRQMGNWTRIAFLYEADDYVCSQLSWPTFQMMLKKGTAKFTVAYAAAISGNNASDEQIRSTLIEASKAARIMLTCVSALPDYNSEYGKAHRYDSFSLRVLSQAYLLGMHSGQFQWMAYKITFLPHMFPPYAAQPVNLTDLANEHYSLQPIIDKYKLPVTEPQLYEIYRSVFEFDQLYSNASYDPVFNREVMSAAFQPPWNVNRTEFDTLVKTGVLAGRASRFANCLVDGIYLYGRGLRDAIRTGLDYTNSAVMRSVIQNISFDGKSGPFAINSDGKRLTDLTMYGPVRNFYEKHPLRRFEKRGTMRCASRSAAERAAGMIGKLDLMSPLEWYGADNNKPPPDIPVCGWKNENFQLLSTTGIVLVACAAAFVLFAAIAIVYVYVRRKQRLAALLNTDWNLQASDLTWPKTKANSLLRRRRTLDSNASSIKMFDEASLSTSRSTMATTNDQQSVIAHGNSALVAAVFKGNVNVFVKPIKIFMDSSEKRKTATITVGSLSMDCLRELRAMKDADQDNVNRFVGIVVTTPAPDMTDKTNDSATMLAVMGFCSKGSLANVLYGNEDGNANLPLDDLFKFGFISDIANGLSYLHSVSHLKWHGRLSSSSVLLDSRWTAKLTSFGFWSFGNTCSSNSWLDELKGRQHDRKGSTQLNEKLLWVAPEVLSDPDVVVGSKQKFDYEQTNGEQTKSRQAADVFSFGIVVSEVLYQVPPYRNHLNEFQNNLTVSEVVARLTAARSTGSKTDVQEPFRPEHPVPFAAEEKDKSLGDNKTRAESAHEVHQLMMDCWHEQADARPTIRQVVRRLAKMNNIGSKSIMDRIITKLEMYAENLELVVQERTSELMDEKQRADGLLSRMLPGSVAEQLKSGKPVVPEHFQEATIFFSDIVSFTTISGASTPMQVVQLLNDLYTFMDSTLEHYAPYVYKVETIGDAYMIVSGIPLRTNLHGRILASVALAFLANIEEAVHVPKLEKADPSVPTHVRLRVGLNSGPCVAGVVGLQMPRYCLFGDTVNVASRMESNGEAMRIHVSHSTWQALQPWPEFTFEDRGVLHIKGKGEMHTYWLLNGPQSVVY